MSEPQRQSWFGPGMAGYAALTSYRGLTNFAIKQLTGTSRQQAIRTAMRGGSPLSRLVLGGGLALGNYAYQTARRTAKEYDEKS